MGMKRPQTAGVRINKNEEPNRFSMDMDDMDTENANAIKAEKMEVEDNQKFAISGLQDLDEEVFEAKQNQQLEVDGIDIGFGADFGAAAEEERPPAKVVKEEKKVEKLQIVPTVTKIKKVKKVEKVEKIEKKPPVRQSKI